MGIDVLQALRELVVQAVHKTDDAATDANDLILLGRRCTLRKLIVILGDLLNGVLRLVDNDSDELVHFTLRGYPELRRHVHSDCGVVVET